MYEITKGELMFLLDTIKEIDEGGSEAYAMAGLELEQCVDLLTFILTKKPKEVV